MEYLHNYHCCLSGTTILTLIQKYILIKLEILPLTEKT